jgi:hypothetical protein
MVTEKLFDLLDIFLFKCVKLIQSKSEAMLLVGLQDSLRPKIDHNTAGVSVDVSHCYDLHCPFPNIRLINA